MFPNQIFLIFLCLNLIISIKSECDIDNDSHKTEQITIICTESNLKNVPMISPFVLHLNLSHNQIEELNQESFVHLPLVMEIDLGYNKIKLIPSRVFAGLGSLKKLYLNNNQIEKIDEYGFRNLHELEELYLQSNPLISLNGMIFKELFKLNHLSIFPLKDVQHLENDLELVCKCMANQLIESLPFCSDNSESSINENHCQSIFDMKPIIRKDKTINIKDKYKKPNPRPPKTEPKKQIMPKILNLDYPKPFIRHQLNKSRVLFRNISQSSKNTNGSSPLLTEVPELIYRINLHDDIRLSCDAIGNPKPNIKWIRFGRTISFNSSLMIDRISAEDDGIYECVARNINGKAAREVKIILIGSISPDSDLMQNSDLMDDIIKNHDGNFQIEDLITTDVLKFVDLVKLLMAHSDNQTFFQASDLMESNLLTPLQATIMNNFTGCVGGSRFEAYNCDEEEHDKYYSITGICNNKQKPSWGSSVEPFLRLLPAQYEDGLVKPIGWFKRHSRVMKPNPRKVTEELLSTEEITNDPLHNHLLMQFGQFLDHDLSFAALSDNRNILENDLEDCERLCQHVEPCFSIPHGNNPRGCIEFKRSAEYCGTGYTSVVLGRLIKREQVNMLTSFIDGSQIYGSNLEMSDFLRSPIQEDNGLLNTTTIDGQSYLPFNTQNLNNDCQPEPKSFRNECFLAGDHRANEQLGLLVFHNIWLRNHNRIATKLKILNPEWSRDKVFHEARQIVAAQLQIITYRDWLPPIIGSKGMKMLGEYHGYNKSVNPSIANSFAAAAMRFGHTLVNKYLIRKLFHRNVGSKSKNDMHDNMKVHKAFFKADLLLQPMLSDSVILGLMMTPLKQAMPQQAITGELTERLFKLSRYTPLDLSSINIQRGRDHALPGYNQWRQFCGLRKASTFDELKYEIKDEHIRNKLQNLYNHPDNIDLYAGGILEDSDSDAKIGPTFRCLLVDQFKRLRDGDRFFYKNQGQFSEQQLKELEKTTLSKIFCNNGDGIKSMIGNAFILPQHQSWIDCHLIDDIDLTKWKVENQ